MRLRPALMFLALALPVAQANAETAQILPAPSVDVDPAEAGLQTAVFAGGCFWGIQGVFEHIKGVTAAVSGYAGGAVQHPSYEQVSTGDTGHAESVRVTWDPKQVSYGTLLRIFFSVGLDPTQKDRQGPDWGTQYRSELFVANPEQDKIARAYLAQLDAAHVFAKPIATRIDPAGPFWPAEAYHQGYLDLHPTAFYIAVNDIPKVEALHKLFPDNWQDASATNKLASAE